VRQPFSVNAIAQAAAAVAIRHQDDVADRVEKNLVERLFVEEELAGLGFETADSEANFSWIDLGDLDEAEVVEALTKAGVAVRPGTPLGGPGHLRVTYGTRPENERFLAALADQAEGRRREARNTETVSTARTAAGITHQAAAPLPAISAVRAKARAITTAIRGSSPTTKS
jgi:hypothetical protein